MDLYSHENCRNGRQHYYRFNVFGWGRVWEFLESRGCSMTGFSGMNDGENVPPDTCEEVAETIETALKELRKVARTSEEKLPTILAKPDDECVLLPRDTSAVNLTKDLAVRRLAGEFDPKRLTKVDDANWDHWSTFAYYVGFAKFCRKCAKLGGFDQC